VSSGHTITGNNFVDGIVGNSIVNSKAALPDNHMTNGTFSHPYLSLYKFNNDLDASNTIEGKPIIYCKTQWTKPVPSRRRPTSCWLTAAASPFKAVTKRINR
jgi:hypothetical protein